MNEETINKFGSLRKGLLEYLVLRIINKEKVYAANILKELSITDFTTQEGTLYPLLSKMRREHLLDYEWKESESGPPRKYYSLTEKGQNGLEELNNYWEHINNTIKKLGK